VAICALVLLAIPSVLHGAKLKWKPVRPITQVQLEQSAKPRTALDAYPVKKVAAQAAEDVNPLADPFEDGRREIESNVDEALDGLNLEHETSKSEPGKAKTRNVPEDGKLDPVEDRFPDLRAPAKEGPDDSRLPDLESVPPSADPSLSDEFRDSPYYEAPKSDDRSDCSDEKSDCADALTRLKANSLANIDLDIKVSGAEGQDFPCECQFGTDEVFKGRHWDSITYNWKASGLCHKPLYFEQVAVERYGHSAPTFVQAVLSGAHFFASVPALPYMMGLCPPDECQYSLGYYRPGSCAPYLIDPIPLSLRAGLFQAGAIAGGILIIP
jgi:hypothetical protein